MNFISLSENGRGIRRFVIFCIILPIISSFFFEKNSIGATVSAGSGSYTDTLPAGKIGPTAKPLHVTPSVHVPIPTSDWWTSIISTSVYIDQNRTGSRRMFAFPLSYRCDASGLIMGVPQTIIPQHGVIFNGYEDTSPFRQQLLIKGVYGSTEISAFDVQCDGYSDWTVSATWRSSDDPSKYFSSTFGHGLIYTYFRFSEGVYPRIIFPFTWTAALGSISVYDSSGTPLETSPYTGDRIALKVAMGAAYGGAVTWFGVYAPPGTVFKANSKYSIDITFPTGQRYLSVAPLIPSDPSHPEIELDTFYDHAYAFVSDTRVNWTVNEAAGTVTTHFTTDVQNMRNDVVSDKPVLALFPHQWKNMPGQTFMTQTFTGLRGTMKLIVDNSFTVTLPFHGIIPCLPARGTYDESHLKSLLATDANQPFQFNGTYYHGKELSRMANLIPIAAQAGDTASLSSLKSYLKSDLKDWFTYTPGESKHFFYYDHTWGGMIGFDTEFGSQNYNDQHFHFGYFVYASALLGLHDPDFVTKYGPMVELLIRSYASPFRNDTMFPFLRTFDPYEGHSWCDGFSADSEDGNNQESSSEAMNSWAAIYLWGLASGNATYRDLGIWGYVTEASAAREYYFNQDYINPSLNIYDSGYQHNLIGILFGGKVTCEVWWNMGHLPPTEVEWLHGIQYMPLNPSMLYLGYNPVYAKHDYDTLFIENGSQSENATGWQPLIWRYQSLYDPQLALAKYNESVVHDESSSQTFLYHWVHVFDRVGTVDKTVRADTGSYAVFAKGGTRTCVCFNPSDQSRVVRFYDSGNTLLGTVPLNPYTMASTDDFTHFTYQQFVAPAGEIINNDLSRIVVYPNPYKPGSGGDYDRSGGILFSNLGFGSKMKIYSVTGELICCTADDDGDGKIEWPAVNTSGKKVASGVYLYYIQDSAVGKKTGKIAVIR